MVHGDTGLGRSARSVLDRNTAGEDTSAMFLGLVRQAGDKTADLPVRVQPEFPVASPRQKRRHQRRPSWLHALLLPLILCVQAGLSLRLIWSNTAFLDEALYL